MISQPILLVVNAFQCVKNVPGYVSACDSLIKPQQYIAGSFLDYHQTLTNCE